MTNDEAIQWCRRRSVVVIFHDSKIVLVIPQKKIDIAAWKLRGFSLEIKEGGFVLAHSDPGDDLKDVVEVARAVWRSKVGPIDAALDSVNGSGAPVKFAFQTDMD